MSSKFKKHAHTLLKYKGHGHVSLELRGGYAISFNDSFLDS